MTDTKVCTQCKRELPLEKFEVQNQNADGRRCYCKDCKTKYSKKYNPNRMWVNGKYIPKTHPLWKPGRYKTLDDAWSHTEIDSRSTAGEVYIIRNKAWPDWLKVGKAVNAEDRLNNYQTSSPFRDFVLCYAESFDNRHQAEAEIHRMLEKHINCHDRKGEWFKTFVPIVREVMNEYRTKENGTGYRDEHCPQHDLVLCDTGC